MVAEEKHIESVPFTQMWVLLKRCSYETGSEEVMNVYAAALKDKRAGDDPKGKTQ